MILARWICFNTDQNTGADKPDYFTNMQRKPVSEKDKASVTDDPGGPFCEWPWTAVHLTNKEEHSSSVSTMK